MIKFKVIYKFVSTLFFIIFNVITNIFLHKISFVYIKKFIYTKYIMIEPNLEALAKSKRCLKMICRKCYARLPQDSLNCRKCKSSDLRKKHQLSK